MCNCGCKKYIDQGDKAIIKRVQEIVQNLKITADNLKLFEYAESICSLLGTKTSLLFEGGDVWEVVKTVQRFHETLRPERNKAAVQAAREIFSKLPVQGNTKRNLTLYQQLEQLCHVITDEMITSIEKPELVALLKKMGNVRQLHEECTAELVQHYKLV